MVTCSRRRFVIFALGVMSAHLGAGLRAVPASGDEPATRPAEATDWALGPFVRSEKPVLSPTAEPQFDCPIEKRTVRWEQQNVYNPAVVLREGKVHLLYRADDGPKQTEWGRTCRIGLAWSEDGRRFTRLGRPVLYPDNDACSLMNGRVAAKTCTSSRTRPAPTT